MTIDRELLKCITKLIIGIAKDRGGDQQRWNLIYEAEKLLQMIEDSENAEAKLRNEPIEHGS